MKFAAQVIGVVALELVREWLDGLFEMADEVLAEVAMWLVRMEARL